MNINKNRSSYEIAIDFHRLIQQEINCGNDYLSDLESKIFQDYYYKIKINKSRRHFYEHNYAERLQHAISAIDCLGIYILDAGCGVGSESLFFATLGSNVLSIDLNADRIRVAKRRLLFYKELLKGKINFLNTDIFKVSESGKFDIIWSMESVSHIDPLNRFLDHGYINLKKGGKIIITDSNGLNAYIQLIAFKERGTQLYTHVRDPDTNELIKYAQERLITITSLKKRLVESGFSIEKVYMSGFLHPCIVKSSTYGMSLYLENLLRKIPLFSLFSGVYTVVARK